MALYLILSTGSGHIAVPAEHDTKGNKMHIENCPGGDAVGVLAVDVNRSHLSMFPLNDITVVPPGNGVMVWFT